MRIRLLIKQLDTILSDKFLLFLLEIEISINHFIDKSSFYIPHAKPYFFMIHAND